MKLKTVCFAGLALFALTVALAQEHKHSTMPPKGYVTHAETATQIAVAVWTPIYGAKKIEEEKPYKAHLENGVWTVEGSLPKQFTKGGVAVAEIAERDGRILRVSHGK